MNKIHIEQYPDINNLLNELLSEIQDVLGTKLVGFYLYGSLVWGDFDHKISDIDLLAAVSTDINDKEFEKLKEMHEDFVKEHAEWNDRIEVQYLSLEALKTFKSKDSKAVSISPGEPIHIKEVGKHWLMNWYIVREKGLTLFGPEPKTIIGPISKEEFIQSVKGHVENWNEWVKDMHSRKAQAYAILTMCRALFAYRNGEQPSKKQAALWTRKELPEWSGLIQNALDWREEEKEYQDDKESYPKTVKFVNFVRSQILE